MAKVKTKPRAKVQIWACRVEECDRISGSRGTIWTHMIRKHGFSGSIEEVRPVAITVELQRNEDDEIEVVN